MTAASLDIIGGSSKLIKGYAYDDLGNVAERTQWWDGAGFSEKFHYDPLNRLADAQVFGQPLQVFTYDVI